MVTVVATRFVCGEGGGELCVGEAVGQGDGEGLVLGLGLIGLGLGLVEPGGHGGGLVEVVVAGAQGDAVVPMHAVTTLSESIVSMQVVVVPEQSPPQPPKVSMVSTVSVTLLPLLKRATQTGPPCFEHAIGEPIEGDDECTKPSPE